MGSDINVTIVSQQAKMDTQILFEGAISASVTEPNATIIDLRILKANAGCLEAKFNSGTGTWSIEIYASSTNTGTFLPYTDATGAAKTIAIPATGSCVDISDIRANYIKFVPTITGTSNMTFSFTPTPQ